MKILLAILMICLISIGAAVPVFESSGNVHGHGQGTAMMSNPYASFYYNYGGPVNYNYYYYGSVFPYYYSYWFYWR